MDQQTQPSNLNIQTIASGMFYLALADAIERADSDPNLTKDELEWVRGYNAEGYPNVLPPVPVPGSSYCVTMLNGGVQFDIYHFSRTRNWILDNPEVLVIYWETLGSRIKASTHPVMAYVRNEYQRVVDFLDKELVIPYL